MGDVVVWNWTGGDRDHTVTADPGQAESFDSDPSGPPLHPPNDTFTHTFSRVGTFTYFCKVHPGMRGEVRVIELKRGDSERPRISGLRFRRKASRLVFRLSETADVTGRIQRRRGGRWRTARTFTAVGKAGPNSRRLRLRGLRAGRYRIAMKAYDLASNVSRTRYARLRIRR